MLGSKTIVFSQRFPTKTELYNGGILLKSWESNEHQAREPPAPLNIPTPTPAPDRGGPVACLGGPVAFTFVNSCRRRSGLFIRISVDFTQQSDD